MPDVVEVTVISQKGGCGFGHKVGDKIVFDGRSVKGDICYRALNTLFPKIFLMSYGVEFPPPHWNEEDGNVMYNGCPNPGKQVSFKIRRVRE